jgi:hypothetical protein
MAIDVDNVAKVMAAAAKGVFKERWPSIEALIASETRIFAERFATIERLKLSGSISEARARSHIEFQKQAWETVLLSVQGMNQLMIEEALNAALAAVRGLVNTAIGFALI